VDADDEATARMWQEIAPAIDRMSERISDPDDFRVSPGSSLAGDDAASDPFQVSHAVRLCLVAGVDHLHALKALVLDRRMLHLAAPFSLVRGGLENLATAFWILHPKQRDVRVERALRWKARDFKDQHNALSKFNVNTSLPEKLAKVDAVAINGGISTKAVRAGYHSSAVVEYADEHLKSKLLFFWQLCSGYAHGRHWAYLDASVQEHYRTDSPGVLNARLTTDFRRVLIPTQSAVELLSDVLNLMQQRSQAR
jgi:hypothetical protein